MVNKLVKSLVVVAVAVTLPGTTLAHRAKSNSSVAIVEPADGTTVTNPVTLKFQAERIEVNAVGVRKHRAGHIILLINTAVPESDEPVVRDKRHVHFVDGETEAVLELPHGETRLQILLGDEEHERFQEWLVSDPVTVYVAR